MKNSSLEIRYLSVQAIKPYSKNARTHSEQQIDQICASIERFGWTNPILIDEGAQVIAGHGRLAAAKRLGINEVPTIRLSGLSDTERRALVLADNKLSLNAGWDDHLLALELQALQSEGFDLGLTGFDDAEIGKLFASAERPLVDPDSVEDPPAEPVCRLGQVWRLGRHRLVCGDTQDDAVIKASLCGAEPDLIAFDPPFEIDAAWTWCRSAPKLLVFCGYETVPQAFRVGAAYRHCYQFVWDNLQGWWTHNRPLQCHKSAFYFADDPFWDCDAAIMFDEKKRKKNTNSNSRGIFEYEPLPNGAVHLMTVTRKAKPLPPGATPLGSVYAAPKAQEQMASGHPHSKPIQWVRAILAGARAKVVLDQFAGSGTTFLAAPKTTTVCGIELDPANCDLIIARWNVLNPDQPAEPA